MISTGSWIMLIVVILIAAAGALWGLGEAHFDFRARNAVEQGCARASHRIGLFFLVVPAVSISKPRAS